MGAAMAVLGLAPADDGDLSDLAKAAAAAESGKPQRKDNRKRNSLVTDIIDFSENKEDMVELCKKIEKPLNDKRKKMPDWTKEDPRHMREAKCAEEIACGNMRVLRNQIIGHFAMVNKNFAGGWLGDALLHICVREGYYAMVEFMINPKNRSMFDNTALNIDVENDKWRSPLHVAFTPPSATFMAVKYGFDENTGMPNEEQPTGLQNVHTDWVHVGKEKERFEIIKILIAEGADVNKQDFHEYTPLHYASMLGWVDAVRLLIEKGATIDAINFQGQNALMVAAEFNNANVVEVLLEETEIALEARNVDGETALCIAIHRGHVELVRMLCEFGADTNTQSFRKLTPLKYAAQLNNLQMCNILLDYKAQRRKSAINMLKDDCKLAVVRRLEDERVAAKEAAELEQKAGRTGLTATVGSQYSCFQTYNFVPCRPLSCQSAFILDPADL